MELLGIFSGQEIFSGRGLFGSGDFSDQSVFSWLGVLYYRYIPNHFLGRSRTAGENVKELWNL